MGVFEVGFDGRVFGLDKFGEVVVDEVWDVLGAVFADGLDKLLGFFGLVAAFCEVEILVGPLCVDFDVGVDDFEFEILDGWEIFNAFAEVGADGSAALEEESGIHADLAGEVAHFLT